MVLMIEPCDIWIRVFVVAFLIIGGTTIVLYIAAMLKQLFDNYYMKTQDEKIKHLENELDELRNS